MKNIIEFFKKAPLNNNADLTLFQKINSLAIRTGYIVEFNACSEYTLEFIKSKEINYNTTFYKNWKEINNLDSKELFFNQLLHYMSTYGKSEALEEELDKNKIDENEIFMPNFNINFIPFHEFKIIKAVPEEEIFNDIINVLESGVALNYDTSASFLRFIKKTNKINSVEIDNLKNKEFKAMFIFSTFNERKYYGEFDILRAILYGIKLVGEDYDINQNHLGLLIKDNNTITNLKAISRLFKFHSSPSIILVKRILNNLDTQQKINLSKIFNRFKPIFLAFKAINPELINKLNKLSKKHHTPFKNDFWSQCLNPKDNEKEVNLKLAKQSVDSLSNFRKIKLLEEIKLIFNKINKNINIKLLHQDMNMKLDNLTSKVYFIRNGKTYIKEGFSYDKYDQIYLLELYLILYNSLIHSVEKNIEGKTIVLPKDIELTCPSSEKMFLGDLPIGSTINLPADFNSLILGINWDKDAGAEDLDIHFINSNDKEYCYYSTHKDDDIIFSGDITYPNPEATECFLFKNLKNINGTMSVFRYHTTTKDKNYNFNLFCAKASATKSLEKNYMVDPNDLIFSYKISIPSDISSINVALIKDKKVYISNGSVVNKKNAFNSTTFINAYKSMMGDKIESKILLSDILRLCGNNVKVFNDKSLIGECEDKDLIDFSSTISKNDLIKIFTG